MASGTDFSLLYAELDLQPGTDMDGLKHAYRRRVSMLHPDANGGRGDVSQLQSLNQLYDAAIDFHRVHGRLPGAARRASPDGATGSIFPQGHTEAIASHAPDDGDPPRSRRRWHRTVTVAVVAVVLAMLWLQQADPPTAPPADAPGQRFPGRDANVPPGQPTRGAQDSGIGLGVHRDRVAAIQGKPHVVDGSRWVYGPSWIEFRCAAVVDWYSSPLHPLQVAWARPSADTPRLAPEPPGDCRKD